MPLPRPSACLFALFGLVVAAPLGAATGGRVFLDRDGDGSFSAGDTGLPRVAVSDGVALVRTDGDGAYRLEPAAGQPYVFVILPRGYRAAGSFYVDARQDAPIDFPLVEWPESRADDIRFAQITDVHVGVGDTATFVDDIREINALTPPAAFVMATGDLVNVGNQEVQMQAYREAMAAFDRPLFNLPGNHDVKDAEGLAHYHRYLGPDYYSFNAGNCHFILLNSLRYNEAVVQEWLRQDLAAAPAGATLVFAMHFLPTPAQMEFMGGLGAKAVLSGHWHGHRVQHEHGVLDLNTPTLRFGGIDRHPRSFRVVEIAGGEVKNELRLGGFRRHATIVAPAGAAPVADGRVAIAVNAYDTRTAVESVTCEIAGAKIELKRSGEWTWTGSAPVPAGAGEQKVVAQVRAANGESWTTTASFQMAAGSPDAPRLRWVASTGGFIGISSPQAGREGIVIGADDSGSLEHCGVFSFDRDGRERWHFHTDSGIKNNVAVADGRVFATSVAGWLYALDEASGSLLWKASLGRDRSPRWEVAATVAADGVVHVGALGYIAAFEAATGQLLWSTSHGPSGDWTPISSPVPVIAQGKVLIAAIRQGLLVLDAKTGAVAWNLRGRFTGCVVVGDTVLTTRDGVPVALALDSGEVRWSGSAQIAGSASRLRLAGDRLVVGLANGQVCAVSARDGSLLWSTATGPALTSLEPYKRGGSDVNSSPAVHGGRVYVGASDGKLHVLALADGRVLATYDVGAPIASSPLVVGNTLYVGGYDGNVYAFTLAEADASNSMASAKGTGP